MTTTTTPTRVLNPGRILHSYSCYSCCCCWHEKNRLLTTHFLLFTSCFDYYDYYYDDDEYYFSIGANSTKHDFEYSSCGYYDPDEASMQVAACRTSAAPLPRTPARQGQHRAV